MSSTVSITANSTQSTVLACANPKKALGVGFDLLGQTELQSMKATISSDNTSGEFTFRNSSPDTALNVTVRVVCATAAGT
jgi:hypothetical protein